MKDLRIFNKSLKEIVIVDNSLAAFRLQLDNGIPILNFYDDPEDDELMHLIYYFPQLDIAEDVRIANRNAFQLKELSQ